MHPICTAALVETLSVLGPMVTNFPLVLFGKIFPIKVYIRITTYNLGLAINSAATEYFLNRKCPKIDSDTGA